MHVMISSPGATMPATCECCYTIEPTRPPGQRRVDGVGRPKFDFHTGRRASASAIINPWSSTLGLANRATTVLPIALPFSKPASQASPIDSSGSSSSSLLSSRGAVCGRVALPRRPRRGGAAAALHNRGGRATQPWHGAASHTTARAKEWRIAASAFAASRRSQLYNRTAPVPRPRRELARL